MSVPFEQQSQLELAVQQAIDSTLVNVHTINTGTILAFYPDSKPPMADVQLGVQKYFNPSTGPYYAPVSPLKMVPVLFPRAGDFIFTFPLKPGDSCLVLFCERDITQFLAKGHEGPQKPIEMRKHSYSDALVLPMLSTSAQELPEFNTSAMEIRTLDGTVRFSVGNGNVTMKVGGCQMIFNSTGIHIVNGDVSVDGGITLKTHLHTSASAGSPTSPPIPPLLSEEKDV